MNTTAGTHRDDGFFDEPVGISVLVDDAACPGDEAEHGFAVWVRYRGTNILFDTGQGSALFANAARRTIALDTANVVVLSHGHYDHTGGVARMLALAPKARFVMHPAALKTRFAITPGQPARSIGMPEEARPALLVAGSGRVSFSAGPSAAAPGAGITGAVPRLTAFEDTGGPFFLDERGGMPDELEDDQALWLATGAGPVVCVGCAHAGLINTLQAVCRISGESRIRAVIGGLHLLNADDARLQATVAGLRALGVAFIAPCHCTGERAVRALAQAFPGSCVPCRTGTVMRFLDDGRMVAGQPGVLV